MTPLRTKWLVRLALLVVLWFAFALRVEYLTRFDFHIDEFYTLPAAAFVAEQGTPTYPTGYFYDPGLPYTYVTGAFFAAVGFSEAVGRFPAVIFGVLAVATLFLLGRRVLRAPWVGVLAALLLAVDVDAVAWGGRARHITLAQWLALLSMALLWVGLTRPSMRARLAFAISNALMLLAHFATVVLLPAWGVVTLLLWRQDRIVLNKTLFRDGAIAIVPALLALSSGIIFQPPPSLAFQQSGAGLTDKTGELGGKFLQFPPAFGHAAETYLPYFTQPPYLFVTGLAIIAIGFALFRAWRRRQQPADNGTFYLAALVVTVLLSLTLLIDDHWQRTRYLLMQLQGPFFLLGTLGVAELANIFSATIGGRWLGRGLAAASLTGLLLWPQFGLLQTLFDTPYLGWNRYDLAIQHVADQRTTGDRVLSMNPPPLAHYLGQSDGYLVQSSPKLIVRPDGQPGDRYTGAIWLDSAAQFNDWLAQPERTWLVAQEFWLFNSYDAVLRQQILQQMTKAWGEGGVWALVSKPDPIPLAETMDTPLADGRFWEEFTLLGYSLQDNLRPAQPAALTLFWEGPGLPRTRKIFVQVRDAANNTVAQADHFIYDGQVTGYRWAEMLADDGVIRDGVRLHLPPDLPAGTYRILVGVYDPETFARAGVINDQTGEAAILLHQFVLE